MKSRKAKDLKKLIKHKRVLGLGEMMNYPGVLNAAPEVLEKLELFHQKIIDDAVVAEQTHPGIHAQQE